MSGCNNNWHKMQRLSWVVLGIFFCFPSQLLEYTYRELAEVLRVHEITSNGCFRDASRDCIRNHDNAASAKRRQIRCLQRACKPRSRGSPERVHEAHQLPVLAHCSHRSVQPGPSVQNCRNRPSQGVWKCKQCIWYRKLQGVSSLRKPICQFINQMYPSLLSN